MNRNLTAAVALTAWIGAIVFAIVVSMPLSVASATSESVKLPYEAGQSFTVTQGYDSPPTHVGKDIYAMDLTQDGCDAYGKLALAASPGTVMLAQQSGYNGGYGTQVLVKNENNIVTRYAHMIPGTIPVAIGDSVAQGEPLGEIGNTGLVEGAACPAHPGAHIHFAMYGENADGSFSPYKPEPISGYVGITTGKWYLSDNAIAITTAPGATAIIERAMATVFGDGDVASENNTGENNPSTNDEAVVAAQTSTTGSAAASSSPSSPSSLSSPINQAGAGGGVSVAADSSVPVSGPVPLPAPTSPQSSSTQVESSTPPTLTPPGPAISITNESFNSTTLAIDLAWQASGTTISTTTYEVFQLGASANAGAGTSSSTASSTPTLLTTTTATTFSYPLATDDFAAPPQFEIAFAPEDNDADSTLATIATFTPTISLPDWGTVIQPVDDTNSDGSWYDDNWYDLGTNFYGTIRSLTLEGFIDNSDYFASHLYLEEYLDSGYTQLNQTYTISDGAPFTNSPKKVTINGLNIPLQSNKYYRLRTYQDYQNRSVILEGTSATGTAMWDEYIYGTGGVHHQYSFYPYLAAIMIPNYPPLAAPNAPPSATVSFDLLNSAVDFSWPPATDPDTTSSLLTYQWNIATTTGAASSTTDSSAFDPAAWQSVGKNLQATSSVIFGNSYEIGVRAVDDFGNIGAPLIQPWSFPIGYAPVPQQLDYSAGLPAGAQKITLLATTTISGIGFWIQPSPYSYFGYSGSDVAIHADNSGSVGSEIATSAVLAPSSYEPAGERVYPFSPSVSLSAGIYWLVFEESPGQGQTGNTEVFGSNGDTYSGGYWSTAPGQDAYFQIEE